MKKTALVFFGYFFIASGIYANDSPTPEKATLCSACHGSNGISFQDEWPNLAGQHKTYLIKQLNDMKKGSTRKNGSMSPILATLSTKDIDDLAAYYAKMPRSQKTLSSTPPPRGEQLYRRGDLSNRIIACSTCHGPGGTGNEQAGFPIIAGQHAQYVSAQLSAFKKGQRKNDLNHVMHDLCQNLSQEDMDAVAQYIETLK